MTTIRRSFVLISPLVLIFAFSISPAFSGDYENLTVTPIRKTTTTTDGRKVAYPKTEMPEVTAITVEIPVGGETGWHTHPVPVYAYVLAGELGVEMENGGNYSFKEGDAIVEVVNMAHNGRNTGKMPVKLVVFYTGVEGSPNTIKVQHK